MASYQQFAPPPQQTAASIPYTAVATNGGVPARSRVDDYDDQLVEAIERLLSAESNRRMQASSIAACRQGAPSTPSTSEVGPLIASELEILSLCCTRAAQSLGLVPAQNNSTTGATPHGFGSVDGDLLTSLCELLEKHVNLAVTVDLVQEAIDVIHKREVKMDQVCMKKEP